jgi:hypothetical protein
MVVEEIFLARAQAAQSDSSVLAPDESQCDILPDGTLVGYQSHERQKYDQMGVTALLSALRAGFIGYAPTKKFNDLNQEIQVLVDFAHQSVKYCQPQTYRRIKEENTRSQNGKVSQKPHIMPPKYSLFGHSVPHWMVVHPGFSQAEMSVEALELGAMLVLSGFIAYMNGFGAQNSINEFHLNLIHTGAYPKSTNRTKVPRLSYSLQEAPKIYHELIQDRRIVSAALFYDQTYYDVRVGFWEHIFPVDLSLLPWADRSSSDPIESTFLFKFINPEANMPFTSEDKEYQEMVFLSNLRKAGYESTTENGVIHKGFNPMLRHLTTEDFKHEYKNRTSELQIPFRHVLQPA